MITEWEVSFYFKEESSIKSVYLQEEIIHAVQELDIYGIEYMEQARKNVEFEAKIIQDITEIRKNGLVGYIGTSGQTSEFSDDYIRWTVQGAKNPNILIEKFHEYCNRWTGYSGNIDPNFTPRTMEKYLK